MFEPLCVFSYAFLGISCDRHQGISLHLFWQGGLATAHHTLFFLNRTYDIREQLELSSLTSKGCYSIRSYVNARKFRTINDPILKKIILAIARRYIDDKDRLRRQRKLIIFIDITPTSSTDSTLCWLKRL